MPGYCDPPESPNWGFTVCLGTRTRSDPQQTRPYRSALVLAVSGGRHLGPSTRADEE